MEDNRWPTSINSCHHYTNLCPLRSATLREGNTGKATKADDDKEEDNGDDNKAEYRSPNTIGRCHTDCGTKHSYPRDWKRI